MLLGEEKSKTFLKIARQKRINDNQSLNSLLKKFLDEINQEKETSKSKYLFDRNSTLRGSQTRTSSIFLDRNGGMIRSTSDGAISLRLQKRSSMSESTTEELVQRHAIKARIMIQDDEKLQQFHEKARNSNIRTSIGMQTLLYTFVENMEKEEENQKAQSTNFKDIKHVVGATSDSKDPLKDLELIIAERKTRRESLKIIRRNSSLQARMNINAMEGQMAKYEDASNLKSTTDDIKILAAKKTFCSHGARRVQSELELGHCRWSSTNLHVQEKYVGGYTPEPREPIFSLDENHDGFVFANFDEDDTSSCEYF